jgi:hypothetical protein
MVQCQMSNGISWMGFWGIRYNAELLYAEFVLSSQIRHKT